MKQSQLFTKTLRSVTADEVSINAQLLTRAGFIDKALAGAYTYLPLGLRVFTKICNIIREEMNAIGAQELNMTSLQPKELWEKTGRWVTPEEIMYKFETTKGQSVGLAWTHEEPVTQIAKLFINSYRDLPRAVYQLQTKFRNEPRAKSGLIRTREFVMKDLYSFHATETDLDEYYEVVKQAYLKIYKRCGLQALVVEASGGAFTKKFSHEFQVPCEAGEDLVIYCAPCSFAQNKEVCQQKSGELCPTCKKNNLVESKSVEVGNIFKLGTKFSESLGLNYTDDAGVARPVIMASYGIGPGRVMGTIVEASHDDKGIIWPMEVAPYQVHLLAVGNDQMVQNQADTLYEFLKNKGVEVLYDDRNESAGVKFQDSDLMGLPWRAVVSARTGDKIELKSREAVDAKLVSTDELLNTISVR